MNKYFLSLSAAAPGVFLLLGGIAVAQDAKPDATPGVPAAAPATPPAVRSGQLTAEERLKRMQVALGLSDDQVVKLKPIFESADEKMKAIVSDASLSRDEKRAKFADLTDSLFTDATPILTPDQKEKWKAGLEQSRARHPVQTAPPSATTTPASVTTAPVSATTAPVSVK